MWWKKWRFQTGLEQSKIRLQVICLKRERSETAQTKHFNVARHVGGFLAEMVCDSFSKLSLKMSLLLFLLKKLEPILTQHSEMRQVIIKSDTNGLQYLWGTTKTKRRLAHNHSSSMERGRANEQAAKISVLVFKHRSEKKLFSFSEGSDIFSAFLPCFLQSWTKMLLSFSENKSNCKFKQKSIFFM